jgi:hypothetical protein
MINLITSHRIILKCIYLAYRTPFKSRPRWSLRWGIMSGCRTGALRWSGAAPSWSAASARPTPTARPSSGSTRGWVSIIFLNTHHHHHSPLQSTAGLWASSTLEGFAIISTLGRRVGDRSTKSYFTRERYCPFPVQSSPFVASYDTLGKRRGN